MSGIQLCLLAFHICLRCPILNRLICTHRHGKIYLYLLAHSYHQGAAVLGFLPQWNGIFSHMHFSNEFPLWFSTDFISAFYEQGQLQLLGCYLFLTKRRGIAGWKSWRTC